jgi:hypothetical protein
MLQCTIRGNVFHWPVADLKDADMESLNRAGEAMLLAEQGRQEIARALVAAVSRWWSDLKSWRAHLPTNLPPTESVRR